MEPENESIRSFEWYGGQLPWLKANTIALQKAGSHSYGTNIEGSDLDLRGVCIAPRNYYLGFHDHFEQVVTESPYDSSIYDIKKFFALASQNNPNILEQLYTAPDDYYVITTAWEEVLSFRDKFLSRRCRHTFGGYAHAQMKRIKTHRKWLLDPPKGQPSRVDFGLPAGRPTIGKDQLGIIESRCRKLEDSMGGLGSNKADFEEPGFAADIVETAVSDLELDRSLIPIILAERRYSAACRTWSQYQTWKAERNEKRRVLEEKYGYDTKHGMHLIRLLRMGHEILSGKGVVVKRPDAEELLAIRDGAWSFDKLMEHTDSSDASLEAAEASSPLPWGPDIRFLDNKLIDIISRTL